MNGVHEHCGVFAIMSLKEENIIPYIYWALLSLNHRGQQSHGILVYRDGFKLFKGLGLVEDSRLKGLGDWVDGLSSNLGIGHVRYATSGNLSREQLLEDAQPQVINARERKIGIAYNGNIVNVVRLRQSLLSKGFELRGTSDTEVLAYLLLDAIRSEGCLVEGIRYVMGEVDGAYSVVGITDDGMFFAFRDPHGIRPLAYSIEETRGLIAVASESVAFNVNGLPLSGFVRPGEAIVVDSSGMERYRLANSNSAFCAFEYAYFARPDSKFEDGCYVFEIRRELGRRLAIRYSEIASRVDVIVPVPQTAIDAAYGFHEESGKPIAPLIVRHRYVRHRAFIMSPEERSLILSKKYNILLDRLRGLRVALIDDSIVRGDTLRRLVRILKGAGTKEVHIFSTFPKITSPCFYGIDMATFDELVGFNRDTEEIAELLGADSVNYQTISDYCKAVGRNDLCLACVTGKYPTRYAQDLARRARREALLGHKIRGRIVETLGR
ncbi:MAG: amidophosphoribosyltransferase [Thermoprotei archaeon]|nr:amidophosphoribosyltransferase [Thermoprotei archaeon]